MLTVGGLLLGAVLTAPGHVAPAEPVDPIEHRATTAHREVALGLRDPFAPPPLHAQAATGRRPPRPSDTELRDPFASAPPREPVTPRSAGPGADLRPPFDPAAATQAAPPRATEPHAELRDPFG